MHGGDFGAWGVTLGLAVALFDAITVLVLRALSALDVFTGIVCASVYSLSGAIAPWVYGTIGMGWREVPD